MLQQPNNHQTTMSECPICFKKANYTTSCNHTFCKTCLYKWKNTCPLCRTRIVLEYPNTRALADASSVVEIIKIMTGNVTIAVTPEDKLKIVDKLLHFVWDNRIVIRKDSSACRVIHKKSLLVEHQCKTFGLTPPKILKKTLAI